MSCTHPKWNGSTRSLPEGICPRCDVAMERRADHGRCPCCDLGLSIAGDTLTLHIEVLSVSIDGRPPSGPGTLRYTPKR